MNLCNNNPEILKKIRISGCQLQQLLKLRTVNCISLAKVLNLITNIMKDREKR
jgi:hypothetical protein